MAFSRGINLSINLCIRDTDRNQDLFTCGSRRLFCADIPIPDISFSMKACTIKSAVGPAFIESINQCGLSDPEIIKNDDGRANDITREQVALNTKAFRETVESSTDYKVDIYTNLPWEDELFEGDILADFDIWYADYEKIPQTPYHFTWLQYSNTGVVPGIEGDVDLNLWIRREGEE